MKLTDRDTRVDCIFCMHVFVVSRIFFFSVQLQCLVFLIDDCMEDDYDEVWND